MVALADWDPSGVPKLGITTDATYVKGVVRTWKTFTGPDSDKFLAAKAQRCFAKRDDVACMLMWAMVMFHLPDDVHDLPDWLTRRAEWLRATENSRLVMSYA